MQPLVTTLVQWCIHLKFYVWWFLGSNWFRCMSVLLQVWVNGIDFYVTVSHILLWFWILRKLVSIDYFLLDEVLVQFFYWFLFNLIYSNKSRLEIRNYWISSLWDLEIIKCADFTLFFSFQKINKTKNVQENTSKTQ